MKNRGVNGSENHTINSLDYKLHKEKKHNAIRSLDDEIHATNRKKLAMEALHDDQLITASLMPEFVEKLESVTTSDHIDTEDENATYSTYGQHIDRSDKNNHDHRVHITQKVDHKYFRGIGDQDAELSELLGSSLESMLAHLALKKQAAIHLHDILSKVQGGLFGEKTFEKVEVYPTTLNDSLVSGSDLIVGTQLPGKSMIYTAVGFNHSINTSRLYDRESAQFAQYLDSQDNQRNDKKQSINEHSATTKNNTGKRKRIDTPTPVYSTSRHTTKYSRTNFGNVILPYPIEAFVDMENNKILDAMKQTPILPLSEKDKRTRELEKKFEQSKKKHAHLRRVV